MTRTVPERLADLGKLFEERHKVYGSDYIHVGEVLKGFFPGGITLKTAEEFRRFYMFVFLTSKLNRYAQCMARGEGHSDSLDDESVYAQILNRLDEEGR